MTNYQQGSTVNLDLGIQWGNDLKNTKETYVRELLERILSFQESNGKVSTQYRDGNKFRDPIIDGEIIKVGQCNAYMTRRGTKDKQIPRDPYNLDVIRKDVINDLFDYELEYGVKFPILIHGTYDVSCKTEEEMIKTTSYGLNVDVNPTSFNTGDEDLIQDFRDDLRDRECSLGKGEFNVKISFFKPIIIKKEGVLKYIPETDYLFRSLFNPTPSVT